MVTAEKMVKLACCFDGIKECPKDSNNVIFNTRYYGHEVSGTNYAWCAVFIWDLFRMAGSSELYYGGKKTASCTTLWHYMRSNGQEIDGSQPLMKGDLVFYKFNYTDGKAHHIGMITDTDGKTLKTVIEGNTSKTSDDNGGSVMIRYDRKMSQVIAICRPKYQETEDNQLTQAEFNKCMSVYLDERNDRTPSPWSKEAREWAEKNHILNGDEMGQRYYEAWCTREELVQVLYNMETRGI